MSSRPGSSDRGDDVAATTARRWRKRPVEVEAIQWKGGDTKPIDYFVGQNWTRADARDVPWIHEDSDEIVVWNEPEGTWIPLPVGHWLVRGVRGEFYPVEPSIFEETYEPVE